jgi:hypothetical protein
METLVVVFIFAITIICVGWIIYTKSQREQYTREKYAFSCLAACVSLVTLAISAVSSKVGVFDHALNFIAIITGNPPIHEDPAPIEQKLLVCVIVGFAIYLIFKSHQNWKNWGGLVSVNEEDRKRLHQPTSFISQGFDEGLRLIKREPEREVSQGSKKYKGDIVAPSQPPTIWHEYARELFELWYVKCSFDLRGETPWDPRMRCWRGRDTLRDEILYLILPTGAARGKLGCER